MTADRVPPRVPPGVPPAAMRIGDKERDEVTAFLHDAFAQGRLTREELDERLDVTLAAKTAGDLGVVLADLPGGQGLGAPPVPQMRTPPGIDMGNWGYHLARPPYARVRRGPGIGPFVPLIVGALIAMILVGGVFTVFKVLFFLWIISLVVGAATRHGRRTPTRYR